MAEFDSLQDLVIAAMDFLDKRNDPKVLNDCFIELRKYREVKFIDLYFNPNYGDKNMFVYFGCTRNFWIILFK